ncbi:flagellar motor protein MotB [Acetobacterium wieringae]|uniref:Flagellar motor protein MotB n=1 Tax=Acetobacterium wieringae TaxID=52694 RepID=A0ABY6HH54_9FIRM|nr:flagellar motor protein MotB [Acetobacterium wieringae]UYO63805.1 flagellar motor protein MotB [Acetobacterium wieringae]VUZ27305.1 Motility protein B [Acetobacterium wieringae]
MGKRSKNKKAVNKDAWLNTYADMITLILVFFILLFSMSTIDAAKYKQLVEIFNPAAVYETTGTATESDGSTSPNEDISVEEIVDLEDLYQYLSQYTKENGLDEAVSIEKYEKAVSIKFMSSIFFEPDSSRIKPGGQQVLSDIGQAFKAVEPTIKSIRIDGHTAQADSPVDDRDLSSSRANEVLRFLQNGYITDPAKLLSVGFGQYRPIAPNDTEENRAKNRRVEIIISETEDFFSDIATGTDTVAQ